MKFKKIDWIMWTHDAWDGMVNGNQFFTIRAFNGGFRLKSLLPGWIIDIMFKYYLLTAL